MSGFYVTLPSNSSLDHFPENTKSSYRTLLAKPITLNQPYEVAIVEVNYSPNIKTYLGDVIIHDYYKNIVEGYQSILKVPIYINHVVSADKLMNIISSEIKKTLTFDFYEFMYKLCTEKISDYLTTLYAKYRRSFLDGNFTIEAYVQTRSRNPIFIVIDTENQIFYQMLGGITSESKFNRKLNRWELNFNDIIALSIKCRVRIIFVKYNVLEIMQTFEQMKTIHEYIQIDKLIASNKIPISNNAFNEFLNDEANWGIDLNDNDYVVIKDSVITSHGELRFPFIKEFKSINNQLVSVQLDSINPNSKIELTGKLASMLSKKEYLLLHLDDKFIMPTIISSTNYALIYSDIIEEQFFGDSKINVLKMIPLKSTNDSEVITFFDNLHYVPLCKNNFTSINIQIRDVYGELIQFDDLFTYVVIKLHFRKI